MTSIFNIVVHFWRFPTFKALFFFALTFYFGLFFKRDKLIFHEKLIGYENSLFIGILIVLIAFTGFYSYCLIKLFIEKKYRHTGYFMVEDIKYSFGGVGKYPIRPVEFSKFTNTKKFGVVFDNIRQNSYVEGSEELTPIRLCCKNIECLEVDCRKNTFRYKQVELSSNKTQKYTFIYKCKKCGKTVKSNDTPEYLANIVLNEAIEKNAKIVDLKEKYRI